jgi:hypothetical protein
MAAVVLGAGALAGIATPTPATFLATLGVVAATLETVAVAAIETIAVKYRIAPLPIVTIVAERQTTLVSTNRDGRNPDVARLGTPAVVR